MTNPNLDQQVANHFDEMAEHYANSYSDGSFFSYFFNRRLEIVLDALSKYDRATILDIGCGPGMMAEYSIQRGFEFYGTDISEKMIGECINKFGDSQSTHFSVGKVQKLEFPDSFFDVVLCMGILEYVDQEEISSAIAEVVRVLKPEGQIIVSLMSKNSFFAWHRRLRGHIRKILTGRDGQIESYDDLSRSFEEKIVRALLNSQKLSDVNVAYFGLNIYPYFLEWRIPTQWRINFSKGLDRIIRGRFKWPYMAFIMKARK